VDDTVRKERKIAACQLADEERKIKAGQEGEGRGGGAKKRAISPLQ